MMGGEEKELLDPVLQLNYWLGEHALGNTILYYCSSWPGHA